MFVFYLNALLLLGAEAETPSGFRFAVERAPQYDALFRRTQGWTGADVVASVALSPEKTLWLFGDTWVGRIRNGRHVDATIVNNSVALQRGKDPATASIDFFLGEAPDGKPAAWIRPADGRGFFWLISGVRTPKGLFLFAPQVEKIQGRDDVFAFRQLATWLIEIANPDDPPSAWRCRQHKIPWSRFSEKRNVCFGSGVLRHEGFVYVFGYDEDVDGRFCTKHMVAARAPEDDPAKLDRWRFLSEGEWQDDFNRCTRLFDQAGSECSVSYQPALERFVAVYTCNALSEKIQMRWASRLEGPWDGPVTIYRCPEMASDKRIFCYAAKGHASLSAGDELLVSYVTNSTDFWHMAGDARLYHPRFLRVKLERRPLPGIPPAPARTD